MGSLSIPLSIIRQQLDELHEEKRFLAQVITEHTERIRVVKSQIQALESVFNQIEEKEENPPLELDQQDNQDIAPAKGPTATVLEYLKEHPGGVPKREIVHGLKDKIESESEDRVRLLYNVVRNLEKRGEISLIGNGRSKRCVLTAHLAGDGDFIDIKKILGIEHE